MLFQKGREKERILPWEMIYGVGALVLGLVIAATAFWNKGQSRRKRQIAEEATHEMYKHPRAYKDHEREELEQAAERPEGKRRADH